MLRQEQTTLTVRTHGQGLLDVTDEVVHWVRETGIQRGLLTVFLSHTSASLLVQENADPAVQSDLNAFFRHLVPEDAKRYRHSTEGPDDMPAHIRAALTAASLSIPVAEGRPVLGSWQGVYVFEHRARPHSRHIVLHLIGE